MELYDVAVIGAGPAGLSFAQGIKGHGYRVALIDEGTSIENRKHDDAVDLTQGHGGAGLFSDGKFSFFPSASALWHLPAQDNLKQAYGWTCDVLSSYGLDTPPYPDNPDAFSVGQGEWILKDYPSDYLSLEKRVSLVTELVNTCGAEIISEHRLVTYHYDQQLDLFLIKLENKQQQSVLIKAKRLVLAGGRFAPIAILEHEQESAFRRLEVGFRIEQPKQKAFFRNMKQLDPKLKFSAEDSTVEWRTFCVCRDGETVMTRTQGLWTVSGHSDGPSTELSNAGFNTRILDENIAKRNVPQVIAALRDPESGFSISAQSVAAKEPAALAQLQKAYGDELSEIMRQGLLKLMDKFPEINDSQTKLIGPTLEGVGWYPQLDDDLKLQGYPAWVIGDACGLFRGIIAAMISGYYAAANVQESLR